MLSYLILLFTLVPIIELALLIKVGQHIGAGYTIGAVIFTGAFGAYLAKLQGLIVLQKIQADINEGRMPAERLFDGVIILCSGLLLLTPGFITDIVGFAGLFSPTRGILKAWLKKKARDIISGGKVVSINSFKVR